MPRHRPEPDPLKTKRRELAEQERIIAQRAERLMAELRGDPIPDDSKPIEPPVWRMEEDTSHRRIEPTPARKRSLARRRQRDMILFIILFALFVAVLLIVVWIAYSHTSAPASSGY